MQGVCVDRGWEGHRARDGGGALALSHVELGTPDVRAQVTLPTAAKASGLASQWSTTRRWLWTISPDPGHLHPGEGAGTAQPTSLGDSDDQHQPAPRSVCHAVGPTIELLANGVVVLTVVDDAPVRGTRCGIGAIGTGPDPPSTT